ncbi:MAG: tetratricopeptide repeat protein [Sulfuritalea sp.]
MKLFHVFAVLFIATMLAASVHAQDSSVPNDADAKLAQILNEGTKLAQGRKFREAIERFDSVIAAYEERFRDTEDRVRCARWLGETLYYLLEAGKIEPKKKVIGLSQTWADAYFMKAYILVHVGQFAQAKPILEKAIALSPSNSLYLSELGGIFQREKNWPMALEAFQSAERATEFSPASTKNFELAKAWRGVAYVFVEQKRLDEAETLYRKCLELDKNDASAANELRYIEKVRAKSTN